jgi:putative heme-binding domain-containing protein
VVRSLHALTCTAESPTWVLPVRYLPPLLFLVLVYVACGSSPVAWAQPPANDIAKRGEQPVLGPVQMLVPGFRVRELPVELTNVNNVRFRQDGTLVTLGYNGDIHLLSDSDGDGLEDKVELFWKNEGSLRGPIGMLLTPQDYELGQGVFTPSKGKLSLIVDQDGDDKADKEIIVADGWQEIPQNVDATGVAMDSEGAIYFGLGTANYANAYLIDADGRAQYRLDSDRGTVQKVSPDFKTRETVCTGVRFPIAFAFNRAGDLFCTEQEGATWLPNGNPFDELLHIQPDRHYGFPPRHPVHNPNVIDEPSTFDYAPQHQSTCGMVFNASVNGGPVFGPEWWTDDALVCGESRGKLWRTTLIPTQVGYVASTQLLACLQMLTVDACVAPNGDLVVACHSGPPDWGTGPTGIGKLFRIQMTAPEAPRPASVYANSQREVHIAFDRPLDPLQLQDLATRTKIEYGPYVRAGDRFETLVPPYAAVKSQTTVERHALRIYGASVTSDLRTVILQTDPMLSNVHYAVTLPSLFDEKQAGQDAGLPQQPQVDVDFALQGLLATWQPKGEGATWSGWLPHIDVNVSKQLTRLSPLHDTLRAGLETNGTLTLETQVDLQDILRPQVQPGASLDAALPDEHPTLVIRSSTAFSVKTSAAVDYRQDENQCFEARVTVAGDQPKMLPLSVSFEVHADQPCDFTAAVLTNEDSRLRPLPMQRFVLPWVSAAEQETEDEILPIAELAGGNWGRGRRVFHSAAAACFKCHAINGVGPNIGPDLANLVHRDYASVWRDIKHPSFAINPDYIGQIVMTHDDRILTGVLRTESGKLWLGDAEGKQTEIDRGQIKAMKPASVSVMPENLDKELSPEQVRDLMTFLLTPPPHMPLDSPLEAPPVRSQYEVSAVLAGAMDLPIELRPLHIVLVAGQKDHGPGEHDYPAWQMQWGQLLSAATNLSVDSAWDFPSDDQLSKADVLIFFQKGAWNDARQKSMDAYFARGSGAVYIHWAVNGDDRVKDFANRIGLASKGGSIAYRHGPLSLQVHNTDHPIMRNINTLQLYDESYWLLTGEPQNVTLFGSSVEDGQARPQLWAYERDQGRVFVSIPGHYNWTFDDPIFRTLLLRGIAWTAHEPVDRFNELVPLGARMRHGR